MLRLLTAATVAFVLAGMPFRPAAADDIETSTAQKTVATLLAQEVKDPRDAWRLSDELAKPGKAALKPLRDALAGAGPAQRLAISRALVLLEDHLRAMEAVRALVDDEKVETPLRVAALRLVADEGELEESEWLESRLEATLTPEVKLAMASTLWQLNRANKGKGKDVLLQFLRSTDPDLRAQGALALGEIGAGQEAKAVLQELRDEPSERGRSATLLLKILHLQEEQERELRTAPPVAPGPVVPGAAPAAAGSWPMLDEIQDLLRKAYYDPEKLKDGRLEDAAAQGLTSALDPHTQYFSPEVNARFLGEMDSTYGGVGAFVHGDPKSAEPFLISRPIFGGPVYRAGLRPGDMIVRIDGQPTEGLAQEECVRRLKGPAGTKVVISVMRRGWVEPRDFDLTRARIAMPTTAYDVLPGKIGFLSVSGFADETANEVSKILDEFEAAGIEGLVLDLRWNGGGWLTAAVEIASQFLPRGALVCTERTRPTVRTPHEDRSTGAGAHRRQVPIVVLVNRETASASEILSGALQVNGRARLAGTMTYGKGTMQLPLQLASRPGEPFEDLPTVLPGGRTLPPNGRYDGPERFVDANGNGVWDDGEAFTDANGNQRYDAGETYTDLNGNKKWDPGAAFKITIGQYVLPDGRTLSHEFKVVEGKKPGERVVKPVGGLAPDVEPTAEEPDLWELQALAALEKAGTVKTYVEKLAEKEPALLRTLARSDRRDPQAYPGFDELFTSCETKLAEQGVRRLVRFHVRRQVGDELGRELEGDVVDDLTLQAAVKDLFKTLGKDLTSEPDLAFLAK